MRITVLGAGYMGSAMADVAAKRGHDVTLWGTWLDDALIQAVEEGRDHPRLKKTLHERVRPLRSSALAEALEGAELVVHGVSSEGVAGVVGKAAAHLPDVPIVSVTKGFLPGKSGRMIRIDQAASEAAGKPLRFVHAAGPAKAIEIARSVLTLMTFASADIKNAEVAKGALGGDHLVVETSDDIAGAEICSAMKNAYATGLGLFDGFVGPDCHNARAACFTQAIAEMTKLVAAGGGRPGTAHGSPGVGDLHVTAAAGRNRMFGERVGKGKPAKLVAEEMAKENLLTEGYPAIASAWTWAGENKVTGLPLLDALYQIVWQGAEVGPVLSSLKFGV